MSPRSQLDVELGESAEVRRRQVLGVREVGSLTSLCVRLVVLCVCARSYVFHCQVDDGLIYICMTDQEFPRRIPFAFLEDIKQKFRAAYGDRGRQALAYELNEDFKKVLQKQMVRRTRRGLARKPGVGAIGFSWAVDLVFRVCSC